jgi:outer membrane protein TolC
VLGRTQKHPTAVKAEERRRQAARALIDVVPGARAPQIGLDMTYGGT